MNSFCLTGQTIALKAVYKIRRERIGGFGLLELLIAISIVVVLAALIGVSSRHMIENAARTRCIANLRGIGAANLAYVADNGGKIAARNNSADENGNATPRTEWYRYIWRTYFGASNGDGTSKGDTGFCKEMICPADPTQGGGEGVGASLRRSYNVNQELSTKGGAKRMPQITKPTATMYAGDIDWKAAGMSEYIIGSNTKNLDGIPKDRHRGLANFVFLDGHVETINIADIYPGGPRNSMFSAIQ